MKTLPPRAVLYNKDVRNITGLRRAAARRLLARVRQSVGKVPTAFVTVQDFAAFTGIPESVIQSYLT